MVKVKKLTDYYPQYYLPEVGYKPFYLFPDAYRYLTEYKIENLDNNPGFSVRANLHQADPTGME